MEFSEGDFVDFSKITQPESDQETPDIVEGVPNAGDVTPPDSQPDNLTNVQLVRPSVEKKRKMPKPPKGTTDRWGSVISRIEALYCNGFKMETGYDSSDSFIDDEGLLSFSDPEEDEEYSEEEERDDDEQTKDGVESVEKNNSSKLSNKANKISQQQKETKKDKKSKAKVVQNNTKNETNKKDETKSKTDNKKKHHKHKSEKDDENVESNDYVAAINANPKLFYEISLLCSKLYKEKFVYVEKKLSFLNLSGDDLKKLIHDAKHKKLFDGMEKLNNHKKKKKDGQCKSENDTEKKKKRKRDGSSKDEKVEAQNKSKKVKQISIIVDNSTPTKETTDSVGISLGTEIANQ